MKGELLALLSIMLIALPGAAIYYIEEYSLDEITIAIENDLLSLRTGEYINVIEIDDTIVARNLVSSLKGGGLIPVYPSQPWDNVKTRSSVGVYRLENNCTTMNNTNYVISWNTMSGLPSPANQPDYVCYPLNYTTNDLINTDILLINATGINISSPYNQYGILAYDYSSNSYREYPFKDYGNIIYDSNYGYFYFHLPLSEKLALSTYEQDNYIFLYVYDGGGITIPDNFDIQIEILERSNIITSKPIILMEIFMVLVMAVAIPFILFSTDIIDLKIQKR